MTEPPDAIAVAAHLHDTTVQHAAAALMFLQSLAASELSSTSRDTLTIATDEVRAALSTARDAMRQLDPTGAHLDRRH